MKKHIYTFAYGLSMGITQLIPGLSVATIAIVLGFYYDFLEAVNHFTKNIKKYTIFLAPMLVGMAIGLVAFSSVIVYLLEHYSLPTMTFFLGLIAGVMPHVFLKAFKNEKVSIAKNIIAIIIPIIMLMAMSFMQIEPSANPSEAIAGMTIPYIGFLVVCGVFASAAMIVPGISGSFILLLLGAYPLVAHSLSSIRLVFIDFPNTGLIIDIAKVLTPLGLGIIIGFLSMARIIEGLLKKYYTLVFAAILGLLAGSFYVLLQNPITYQSGVSEAISNLAARMSDAVRFFNVEGGAVLAFLGILTFLLGCVSSFILGRRNFKHI